MKRRFACFGAVAVAFIRICSADTGHAAQTRKVSFDITAPSMVQALIQFSQQSGLQLAFPTAGATELPARPVIGEYTTTAALDTLLAGSGLTYEFTNERTVSIRPVQDARATRPIEGKKEGKEPSSSDFRVAQVDQTNSAPAVALEEIVVTAQKRTEREQDVPISLTAISGESLVENNQLRLQDYFSSVPGLNVTPNVASNQVLSIRGITTGGGTNPTVGVTVDDVPFGSSTNLGGGLVVPDFDPGDLSHVEVLRGPQGTLYGASSMGGLLKFVTTDPTTDAFKGRLQAGLNSVRNGNQAGFNARGSANIPVGEDFALRVSGFTRRDSGYIDNPVLNLHGLNTADVYGGRVAGLWRPTEGFSLKFSALYQESRGDGSSDVDVSTNGYTGPPLQDLQQNYGRNIGGYNRKTLAYTLTLNGKLGAGELTALSGYSINEFHDSWDYSYLYGGYADALFNVGAAPVFDDNRTGKFTQEVRYSIPITSRITWLVGGFYTRENSQFREYLDALDPATGRIAGQILSLSFPTSYREYAGFTDLTVQLNDRFDIQIGGRESKLKQTLIQYANNTITVPEQDTDGSAFTYLVTPRWRPTDDLMVYARFASGYRAGGANGVPGEPDRYDPDKTLNYELGLKQELAQHTVALDASLFYIDWKDIQVQLLDTNPGPYQGLSYTVNGNRARSRGVEVSLQAKPFRGTTLSTWFVFDDAQLAANFPANSSAYGVEGARLPYSSRFSGYLSLDQEFPLTAQVSGFAGAAFSYLSSHLGTFGSAGPTPPLRQGFGGYGRLDFKAGARWSSWTVNLFVNNLTDRRGELTGGVGYTPPFAFVYIQPRTVGLSVTKSFE